MRSPSDAESAATLDASGATAPTLPVQTTGSSTAAVTKEEPGRYATEAELGRGGMGRVLLALDRHLSRDVAMKVLLGGASVEAASTGAVARFVREARVTGQLEHPGIVPVHELGRRDDGTIYYTMKRIRGRSLAEVLREKKTLAERLELASVFRDVCEAMAYAHARGVVHRDLKPDNVMVGEFGETLVVDWGLAKVRGEDDASTPAGTMDPRDEAAKTVDGAVMGTPAYMSPEQARGALAQIDERSDAWALGAILFEILTGRTPFEGTTAVAVIAKVLTDDPPRVRAIEPHAPPELAAIAERALSRDRAARYANAGEIAAEIAAWQDGRAVRAYEYSSWELVRRFVRKNRAATTAAVAILAATLVASGLVYQSYRGEQRSRQRAENARDQARDSDLASRVSLAAALLERAERALGQGDRGAAAIYAAAAMADDPGTGEARSARDRRARAYSVWVEADRTRRFEYVRRIEANSRCAVAGARIVCPAPDGVFVEDVRTSRREHVALRGIADPRFVVGIDESRVMLALEGREAIADVASHSVVAWIPPIESMVVGGDRAFAQLRGGDILVMRTDDFSEIDRFPGGGTARASMGASPDGSTLALRTNNEVLLWRFPRAEGQPARIPAGFFLRAMAFSPDSRLLSLARGVRGVLVIDAGTASVQRELATPSGNIAASWLDGERLALSNEETNQDVEIRPIDGSPAEDFLHLPDMSRHTVHKVGGFLVDLPTSLPDRVARGTVFRAIRQGSALTLRPGAPVVALALDAPRRRLVFATTNAIHVYAADGSRELAALPLDPDRGVAYPGIAVASDGAIAAVTTDGSVLFAEPRAEALRVALPSLHDWSSLLGIAVSRDGDVIFAGTSEGGAIRRWSRTRGALSPLEGHGATVLGLAVSPDGRTLASASVDGTVRIWHLDDGDRSEVVARQEHLFSHVAFSPDGERLAVCDGDGWVAVYEGRRRIAHSQVHDQWVNRVAWWPDGRWIVSASDDGTARVVSADGRVVDRIVRCNASCAAIAPSRDALYLSREMEAVRVPLEPGAGVRDPRALLRSAERRAGVRLEGLELVPLE